MFEIAIAVLGGLFSVVNPLGAVPVFISMTNTETREQRNVIARNTSIYLFFILLSFFLAGTAILGFFGISLSALRVAGGIILFGSGAQLMSGRLEKSRSINAEVKEEAKEREDISFTPLAMPLLSGPGSISLMIGYFTSYDDWEERAAIIAALVVLTILVYSILRTSPYLFKLLGVAGIKAISRIMGFIVMSIGVEMIMSSIKGLIGNF